MNRRPEKKQKKKKQKKKEKKKQKKKEKKKKTQKKKKMQKKWIAIMMKIATCYRKMLPMATYVDHERIPITISAMMMTTRTTATAAAMSKITTLASER